MKKEDLNGFTGTDNWYRHFGGVTYTDGVKFLAEKAQAYWLIDAIASYQKESEIVHNPMLRDMQFWKLSVKDKKATLTCVEDSGLDPVITQEIEYTDFPLEEVDIWVERSGVPGRGGRLEESMVMMLPSER